MSTVNVGDVFYRSWGYDQTNVNFYEVVGLTPSGKSVRLREVRTILRGNGVVPDTGNFIDDEIVTKRIQSYPQYNSDDVKIYITWNSYSSLYQFDGTPKYDTRAMGYAGH